MNEQQLSYERASRQLLAYQALEDESSEVKDMQIILNLSNKEMTEGNKGILNISGAKNLKVPTVCFVGSSCLSSSKPLTPKSIRIASLL